MTSNTLLSINNYYYRRGGAEVVFLEQNRLLEKTGMQIVPFSMQHKKNDYSKWSNYFIDEIEYGNQYSFFKKAKNAFNSIYSFDAKEKLKRLTEIIQPQISHSHNVYHHISPVIFKVLKEMEIPTILTLHDLKIACPAYKMLTHDGICERCKGGKNWNVCAHRCIKNSFPLSLLIWMEKIIHDSFKSYENHVDKFIVPSKFYIQKFTEWGWPKNRFTYIPNFVDVNSFKPQGEPGETFLYFGRLGPEKGIETFIRALALSKEKGIIVGTGPEELKLKSLAEKLKADIIFTGYCKGSDLQNQISLAKAIVIPSEWYENAPMSIMEAYSMERPVIGADIGGIPELIKTGETGLTFPSKNIEALSEQLNTFSNLSQNKIRMMGKAGRNWMIDNFTAEHYIERLLSLYKSLGAFSSL